MLVAMDPNRLRYLLNVNMKLNSKPFWHNFSWQFLAFSRPVVDSMTFSWSLWNFLTFLGFPEKCVFSQISEGIHSWSKCIWLLLIATCGEWCWRKVRLVSASTLSAVRRTREYSCHTYCLAVQLMSVAQFTSETSCYLLVLFYSLYHHSRNAS